MNSFKKIISLNQAAQLSGYTQDYLGYLLRTGELRGIKKGRSWFTTEEEINNYLFKKKVRHRELAVRDFFSISRVKKIILAATIIFIGGFLFSNINNEISTSIEINHSAITSDGEVLNIPNKK